VPSVVHEIPEQPLLREHQVDTPIERVLLVRELERRQKRDGAPFLRMTLADRSGTVPAVLWRAEADDEPAVEPGTPISLTGRLTEHPRYGRQIVVSGLAEPDSGEVEWTRLVDGPARPAAELAEDLDILLGSIREKGLARLMCRLLGSDSPLGLAYRHAPAAKYNHHAYPHGLLEHSVQIAHMVSAGCDVFPGIDRDLAVCGALLHDIGKLDAYASVGGSADLTDPGRLEGEIPLGYYRVRREIEEQGDIAPELARRLLHVILAHHGCLEHGSPVMPSTREAALVHAMDKLSGTIGAFDRLEKETSPDESWSRFDRVLGGSAFFGSNGS
jgi:3'-5' exoribonuclease